MKLTNHKGLRASGMMGLLLIELFLMGLGSVAHSQAFSTTTVQGTVYLANGQPGTGTLVVSWPSFTTASGQVVAADSMTLAIAPDGFVSVNLAANQGATPAGLYYTAIFYLSDGSVNTQYWVVPAATSATLGQVQARLMPSTQAVQAVSKTYVDQSIAALTGSLLTASGGTLSGPLTLCCDPTTPLQAANKRYVDAASALAVPLMGGTLTGPLTATKLGALYQVDQFAGADFGAKLGACLSGLNSTQGGTCDARNFSGTLAMGSNLVISTANATVLLPCATISTANRLIVTAGTRNVTLRGCALRGASTASGSQGGTVFYYSGTGAMMQVGDPTYGADTPGFHLDNAVVNITAATSASAQGFAAYRTQELDLESLYFLGNQNQTGMTLDGTGNYTGGTFYDNQFIGFQTAVNAIGHQITNAATTDWVNASTFVRLHIDCPTSGGSPISGTFGINLQQGDGNTFTGGDVEGCSTALHLGANAQNNTIVGLRNENSTNQVVADAGSAYNDWMTGGTMFTGKLTDNGTRNSFLDTFHRSFNGLNGDWYGSQKDATVTNHYRLGTGAGNERGLLNRYQSDYGYRWTMGLSDATAGEQFYQVLDELNNVYRVSVGQYNNGQSSTNNQTVINAAGTGAVVLNGSNNAGTGGVVIGSGGASVTTVATINNAGNAQFNGSLQVGGASTLLGSATVKNQADAEIDATLWAGLTASQKESFTYKDWNGNSQWYMVKDGSNNWAVNSATGGLDSFKAYQSTNSGDTYINTSNSTGVVRINYETGSGTQFKVYGGNSSTLYASFTGTTSIQFPGLAASSGHNCLQVDNSGYVTNTGSACGGGGGSGTVNSGTSGQIAYYSGTGTVLSGTGAVSVTAGGTGSSTASGALTNLGGLPVFNPVAYGAAWNGVTDDTAAINSAIDAACAAGGGRVLFPAGVGIFNPHTTYLHLCSGLEFEGQGRGVSILRVKPGAGNYEVMFGPWAAAYQYLTFHHFTIDYNTTNNMPTSSSDFTNMSRFAIGLTTATGPMTWEDVEFRDIISVNVIYAGLTNMTVKNCLFTKTTATISFPFDSTDVYVGQGAVVTNNIFKGQIGSNGSVTAIETHGGNSVIDENTITGYETGIIITGQTNGVGNDTENVVVANNTMDSIGYYCIRLWSVIDGTHTTGYGLAGVSATGNTCRIKQKLWPGNIYGDGVTQGIGFYENNDLPMKNILIGHNTIECDLETDPASHDNSSVSYGIGYWQLYAGGLADGVKIDRNQIKNCPGAGIRWDAGGDNIEITNNQIINPGSAANPSFNSAYRSGIFLRPSSTAIPNLKVAGNTITDNNATTRMAYGMVSYQSVNSPFNTPLNTQYLANTINVTGATTTAFQNAYYFSTNTQNPLIQGTVNVPVGTDTPAQPVAYGSFINSIQAGHWYWANQAGTAWADPGVAFTTGQLNYTSSLSADGTSGYGSLQNLFLNSENYTAASWSVSHSSVTANGTTNSFGGSNASTLTEDTSTSGHYLTQTVSLPTTGVYQVSFYVKTNGDNLLIQAVSGTSPYAIYDLTNGVVNSSGLGGTGSIQAMGNGLYRVSLLTNSLSSGSAQFMIYTANSSFAINYTGNGTGGVYLWGAQLNPGSTLLSYAHTTSAAVASNNILYGYNVAAANSIQIAGSTPIRSVGGANAQIPSEYGSYIAGDVAVFKTISGDIMDGGTLV